MAENALPELDIPRHRDLVGRSYEPRLRRAAIVLFAVIAAAGLMNVFGQRADVSSAQGAGASISVEAPASVRGGLIFQARFEIAADRDLAHPVLALQRGWLEGMSINTLEPSPVNEAWRGNSLELTLPPVRAGHTSSFYMQFQVNPTNVGRRDADVTLRDGATVLATVHHTFTIYP